MKSDPSKPQILVMFASPSIPNQPWDEAINTGFYLLIKNILFLFLNETWGSWTVKSYTHLKPHSRNKKLRKKFVYLFTCLFTVRPGFYCSRQLLNIARKRGRERVKDTIVLSLPPVWWGLGLNVNYAQGKAGILPYELSCQPNLCVCVCVRVCEKEREKERQT